MVIYPTRMRLTSYLKINDNQIISKYRCFKNLQVDWTEVLFTDDMEHLIKLLSEGQISIQTDNDLDTDPTERHQIDFIQVSRSPYGF